MISKTPFLIRKFYSSLLWELPTFEKKLYITFDDGPTPGITDKVLDLLKLHSAKASFFCLGKNVQKFPNLYRRILDEGHGVGNHTQNHLNGWKTKDSDYLYDIEWSEKTIQSNLFRPPYGKIQLSQAKKLRSKYKIIMWSVITRDYDSKVSKESCLNIAVSGIKPGSIIVFHDSKKAEQKMFYALEGLLHQMQNMNFISEKIELP